MKLKKSEYDVKIYSGEKPNIKEFHVYSFVLMTQSEKKRQKMVLKKKKMVILL
jgi:hypothetical protein